MPSDHRIGNRQEPLIRALGAFNRAFIAQPLCPLIGTGRLVTGSARFHALKPPGIDIIPAAEKRAEQGDFLIRGALLMNPGFFHLSCVF
jgi:hypothetical protein